MRTKKKYYEYIPNMLALNFRRIYKRAYISQKIILKLNLL